ncbi:MAG TPA: glycosyltransferase family 1 protein [Thermoleophilaceae bacterium]|nr:glycosyltransferase family 1 protein [Thermoleophilaceae bacterium]
MRVAIDARPLDLPHLRAQGIGRYAQGLLGPLDEVARERGGDLVALRAPRRGGFGLDAAAGEQRTLRRPPVPARWADLPEQALLPLDLRRARAELVHGLSIYRTAYAPGVPSVTTILDVAPLMWPEHYLRGGRVHRLLYAAARRATLLLAISDAARADVIAHLRVPEERVITVPLAAADHFCRTDARSAIDGPYLLYVGGLANPDWRKNLDGLLEGFARWQREGDRPEALVMAGGIGPEGERLERRARELGARVVFPGFVADADLPALYGGATCFVTASRYEGFGLPALEAVSCGTPVVAFDAGAIPEVAGPGALLAPEGDVAALMRLAGSVCDEQPLRDRLRAGGLEHAKRYSWKRTAELTWEAYERCLAS